MRKRRIGWRYGLVGAGVVVALAVATVAAIPSVFNTLLHWNRHPLDYV